MNNNQFPIKLHFLRINRGILIGVLIVSALVAFEIFNYSTTEFALLDLLGDLSFAGIRWATILSIAFCGIDFAGIARLFTPEKGEGNPIEVWYLLAAWLLAAFMNAVLTWWGVSVALVNHDSFRNTTIDQGKILFYVPIFVAILVWLIRVLIIGTISLTGDKLFSFDNQQFMDRTSLASQNTNNGYENLTANARSNPYTRPVPSFRSGVDVRSQRTAKSEDSRYSEPSFETKNKKF